MVKGPLHGSELDNAAPERTDYLCEEGYALRYLEIEAKLQVLQEEMGLVYGDAAISFEQHHCERPAGLHISNDIFRAHIQSEMNISCRINDSDENGPHKRNEEGDEERPREGFVGQARQVAKLNAIITMRRTPYHQSGTALYFRIIFIWLLSNEPSAALARIQISSS